MAEEAKIPVAVWVILGLVVLWFLVNKTISANSSKVGAAAGKGAVDAAYAKAAPAAGALGSFISGLFSGSSSSKGGSGPGGQSQAVTSDNSDAVYAPGESFDDYSSGLFGPGINPDGTGA